ncbi:MAG TPA: hypothetical protein VIY52_30215 [Streptosporangiaceae bacterium]
MTSDRKAKKATRARMAAAGERYTTARRKVVPGAAALPAPMTDPPGIDPGEHAIRTVSWGAVSFHLVPYQGRYYVWHCWPGSADVYPVGNAAAGHAVLDARHAFCLLTTPWDQRAAHIFLPPGPGSPRTGYEAAVIVLAEDGGTWLACRDGTAGEPAAPTLARFDDVSAALTAFADHASQAAVRAERAGELAMATALSDHAAAARDEAARPSHQNLPATRPPGTRLPDTPVRTHATHVVDGKQYALVSYTDTTGGKCVAIDQDGKCGAPVCDVEVGAKSLVNAGMTMATQGQGVAAVYGRAHDSVTGLYAVMRNGERVAWPIHRDPRNQERYFAVIAYCQELKDIVATAGAQKASLKRFFPIWFSKAS